ncbi:proline-rich proteoglycan 2 [Stomoxys calcitrans]|uniref:UMA domain-containing protein n=1 Tax=Stomoxys calcitrans TaxID=35570 RepID=A0A1I8Q2F0_STOCA|nr:proline-rich proteoglycan 2 [Stomoxys calcitrans]
MFSFFTKKSQNSDSPVIIQGPSTSTTTDPQGDDFIFVEKKGDRQPDGPGQPQRPMYPPMPAGPYGAPYPRYPYGPPPGGHHGVPPQNGSTTTTSHPVPYVQDVPFVLAPQLCTKTTFDSTQTQVDGILAFLTRQMSVDGLEEYNFTLEQNVLQNE